uniref:DEAD/DEAH box helicase n=1 Tax=Flavobacterium sp. TaxID=239 RepID=UPI0035AE1741
MEKDNHTNYIKPINLVNVEYAQTGQSKKTNEMGMREMQAKAYEARTAKYLLLKAPPASGKSRALMFIALDKLINQGIKKVIVAVPERSIGNSFSPTELKKYGFYANWEPNQKYNLCTPGSDAGKVKAFHQFLQSDEKVLICTHATLRFAFEGLDEKQLNDCLITIDEFHHVSADGDNKLGNVMRNIMANSTAHIVAMTGSYFRGDSVPVLLPEDEEKFVKVTYNYYDQLNGYEYLKSLGIGYHFYQGRYYKVQPERNMSALEEILDEDLKTIIHIPSVNSAESSKEKYEEVNHVIDCIGDLEYQDSETGVLFVKSKRSGRILKIADLVNDNQKERDKIVAYLRGVSSPDDIDMIIALGMAKEGFDWPFCQHALTIGYRGSLTEIIQIIGRATRDSNNKKHAQFTNLIAQ